MKATEQSCQRHLPFHFLSGVGVAAEILTVHGFWMLFGSFWACFEWEKHLQTLFIKLNQRSSASYRLAGHWRWSWLRWNSRSFVASPSWRRLDQGRKEAREWQAQAENVRLSREGEKRGSTSHLRGHGLQEQLVEALREASRGGDRLLESFERQSEV